MSDQITNRPLPQREERIAPEPGGDNSPPQRPLLSYWSALNFPRIVLGGLAGGLFLGALSGVIGKGLRLEVGLAFAPGFLAGATLGVVAAMYSIRAKVGRGIRSNNRDLPRGSIAAPGRPVRPAATGITERPVRLPAITRPSHAAWLGGGRGPVTAVAVSADGRFALTAARDRAVVLWDAQTGFDLLAFHGFGAKIHGVAFSPDGCLVAAVGQDNPGHRNAPVEGIVRIWDAATGQELRRFELPSQQWAMAFLPDGRHLLLAGMNYLRLWEIDGPGPVAMVELKSGLFAFEMSKAVAVSPDGSLAVAGCHQGEEARLVNLARGEVLRTLTGHKMSFYFTRVAAVVSVAFSPDGMRILTGSWDQTARVWNLAGKELTRFEGHRGWWGWRGVVGVAWLDARRAVSVSENGILCAWDVETGEELARHNHGAGVTSLAATPDGSLVLTGGSDGGVRVWDLLGQP